MAILKELQGMQAVTAESVTLVLLS